MTTTEYDLGNNETTSAGIIEPITDPSTGAPGLHITAITPTASKVYTATTKGRNAAARWLAARGYHPDGTRIPVTDVGIDGAGGPGDVALHEPEATPAPDPSLLGAIHAAAGVPMPESKPAPTPTREAFLAAYRKQLESMGWAAQPGALDRFMDNVERSLRGAEKGTWSPRNQQHALKAYRAIGGKGPITMKALLALPSTAPAPAKDVCLAIVRMDAPGDGGPGVIVKSPVTYQEWLTSYHDGDLLLRSNRDFRLPEGARVIVAPLSAGAVAIQPEPADVITIGTCVCGERGAEIGVVRRIVVAGVNWQRALVAWPDNTEQFVDVDRLRVAVPLPEVEPALTDVEAAIAADAIAASEPEHAGIEAFSTNPKILAALRKPVRYGDDGVVLPRHEYIEREVAAGRRVVPRELHDHEGITIERRFMHPGGDSFFDERDMTKSGMDYAEWLTARLPVAPAYMVPEQAAPNGTWDATIDQQRELGNGGAGIAGRTFTPTAAPPDAGEALALGTGAIARTTEANTGIEQALVEQQAVPAPGYLQRAIDDSRVAAFEREPGNGSIAIPAVTALAALSAQLEDENACNGQERKMPALTATEIEASAADTQELPPAATAPACFELDASTPDTRPGFYYVTCRNGSGDYAFIRGPWVDDHAGALAAKRAVQAEGERADPRAVWYAWGTARSELDRGPGVLGGPVAPDGAPIKRYDLGTEAGSVEFAADWPIPQAPAPKREPDCTICGRSANCSGLHEVTPAPSVKYPHGYRSPLDKSPASNVPEPGEDTSTWVCPPVAEFRQAQADLVAVRRELQAADPELASVSAASGLDVAMAAANADVRAQALQVAAELGAIAEPTDFAALDEKMAGAVPAEIARYDAWRAQVEQLVPVLEVTGRTRNVATGRVCLNVSLAGVEPPETAEDREAQASTIQRALDAHEAAWKLYLELNRLPAFRRLVRDHEALLAAVGVGIGGIDEAEEAEATGAINTATSDRRTG